MIYIIIGIFAFLLFVIYDINSIIMKNKHLYCCFFTGFILLIIATMGIVLSSWGLIKVDILRIMLFGIMAVLFLCLMIYTLFFALPFKNTYVDSKASPKVCKAGVYALCRHPGVLWFIGFYTFLGLALKIPLLLTAAVVFSILNILYVIFQDQWTFLRSFEDYDQYKIDTPFLIPNIESIKHCIKTL